MQNSLEIIVPEVSISDTTELTPTNNSLTALQIIEDTSKAGQVFCEPCAIALGCIGGLACCILMTVAQVNERKESSAHHDAVYHPNNREQEASERAASYNLGVIAGAYIPRATGRVVGGLFGLFRAPVLMLKGNSQLSDPVCGLSREKIEARPALCGGCTLTN